MALYKTAGSQLGLVVWQMLSHGASLSCLYVRFGPFVRESFAAAYFYFEVQGLHKSFEGLLPFLCGYSIRLFLPCLPTRNIAVSRFVVVGGGRVPCHSFLPLNFQWLFGSVTRWCARGCDTHLVYELPCCCGTMRAVKVGLIAFLLMLWPI